MRGLCSGSGSAKHGERRGAYAGLGRDPGDGAGEHWRNAGHRLQCPVRRRNLRLHYSRLRSAAAVQVTKKLE